MPYLGNTNMLYEAATGKTIRESLDGEITIINAVEIPLWTSIQKEMVGNRRFDWPIDFLDTASMMTPANVASKLVTAGADATFPALTSPERIWGICQINQTAWDITDTDRAEIKAGREDDLYYQGYKKVTELGVNMEAGLKFGKGLDPTSATQVNTAPDGTNVRQTNGILPWAITGGMDRYEFTRDATGHVTWRPWPHGTPTGVGANGPEMSTAQYAPFICQQNLTGVRPGSAVSQPLTRAIFWSNFLIKAHLAEFPVNGALLLMGPDLHAGVSSFAIPTPAQSTVPVNYRSVSAESATLWDALDVFRGVPGTVFVAQDRYMGQAVTMPITYGMGTTGTRTEFSTIINQTILAIRPELLKIRILRGAGTKKLAITGSSTKTMHESEWGLQVKSPRGLAVATGYTGNLVY